jgi:hypothetical protein
MLPANQEPLVVWEPIPGTSQEIALDTRCHETLYTGSRGPGKTDTQLMRFRRRVGQGYGVFWRGIIFDREYKNLDDLISKSKRWFNKFNDGAKFLESTSSLKWVWPSGEELLFRQVKKLSDYDDYHGHEYPFMGWNELTKYPTSELYDKMISCNRSSFTPEKDSPRDPKTGKLTKVLPSIPLEIFATCNSTGPGHAWVKRRFIDAAPYGQIVKRKSIIFDPQIQEEREITRTQVAIFGSYRENKYLAPEYIAGLDAITDENIRRSWLFGDWDVIAGGAFDDLWRKKVHILPRFKVPAGWYIDRTFDWGSSQPFHVGWWAEANGEEAEIPVCCNCGESQLSHYESIACQNYKPTIFCPVAGSLIQINDWYGTKEVGSNRGLKMAAGMVAEGIKEREIEMLAQEWIARQPSPGPADNQIRDVRENDVETIEKKMSDQGIRWQQSDKSPGSRRNGFQLFRERLENAIKREGQAIYFMENCRGTIATIPVLPRDEDHIDDVDTDAEDHPWDTTRYRVLKGANRAAAEVPVKWPT